MGLDKGSEVRLTIHNILFDIYKFNKNLEDKYIKKKINRYDKKDISFINNVCLNSMRYYFHCKIIVSQYAKKKTKLSEMILLVSSITQIIFLNFKEYAVVNSSVEIAKKLNIYHGFINAILKKIIANREKVERIKLEYNNLPNWFLQYTKNFNANSKRHFINSFFLEPNTHIVFKKEKYLLNFNRDIIKTSNRSGFLKKRSRIESLPFYNDGQWWVQDYSSFIPINIVDEKIINKENIDLCCAPGGKAFQILSKDFNIELNDKSKEKIKLLKKNLDRLKFNTKITNFDALLFNKKSKFDFIILDAPCSAIGTIRRNPEIFFRKKGPNLKYLINLQEKLLKKSSEMVKKDGVILYMVCSFLEVETTGQIDKFLKKNKNFIIEKFNLKNIDMINTKMFKNNNYAFTLPDNYKGYNIDGYFAVCLKKLND